MSFFPIAEQTALPQIPWLDMRGHFETVERDRKGEKGTKKEKKERDGKITPEINFYIVTALCKAVRRHVQETRCLTSLQSCWLNLCSERSSPNVIQ